VIDGLRVFRAAVRAYISHGSAFTLTAWKRRAPEVSHWPLPAAARPPDRSQVLGSARQPLILIAGPQLRAAVLACL
jgi:hypothetical protein